MTEVLLEPVRDRSAWTGPALADDDSWVWQLSPAEVDELDRATRGVVSRGLAARAFDRDAFPLPTLGPRLLALLDELEDGRGFAVLRGIPVDRYDEPTLERLYWGVAVWLGEMISQNARGDLIARVEDTGADFAAPNARGYRTNAALHPHNDSADLVGLLCVRKAMRGGRSTIASATAIYNAMLEQHPEFAEPLARGFHYDVRGEGVTGSGSEVTRNRIPVYSWYGGRLSCRFNARAIRTGAEKAGLPLDELEDAAVRFVTEAAVDPALRLDMQLEPGDLQILNNHVVVHARTHFEDWPEPSRRRLLLRLWVNLRPERRRPLAPGFMDRYNTGDSAGIAKTAV